MLKNWSWVNLRHYRGICVEKLRPIVQNLRTACFRAEYETGMLATPSRYSCDIPNFKQILSEFLDPAVLNRIATWFGRVYWDMDWSTRVCMG
jgi:hypothetical protein